MNWRLIDMTGNGQIDVRQAFGNARKAMNEVFEWNEDLCHKLLDIQTFETIVIGDKIYVTPQSFVFGEAISVQYDGGLQFFIARNDVRDVFVVKFDDDEVNWNLREGAKNFTIEEIEEYMKIMNFLREIEF